MIRTILYWLFIVIVGIFSLLILIGIMAGRNQTGPRLKGFGPQDVEEKIRTYYMFPQA